MLVCSVVLRPERAAIGATVVETANALDDPALGAIYATLADAPGNALDILVAFVGQNIREDANATATVDGLSAHPAIVIEEISAAIASQNATVGGAVPVSPRQSMVVTAMVNSDGTARQANAGGTMINL